MSLTKLHFVAVRMSCILNGGMGRDVYNEVTVIVSFCWFRIDRTKLGPQRVVRNLSNARSAAFVLDHVLVESRTMHAFRSYCHFPNVQTRGVCVLE